MKKEIQITTRPHTAQGEESPALLIQTSEAEYMDVSVRIGPRFKQALAEFRTALRTLDDDVSELNLGDAELINLAARCYIDRIVAQANARSISHLAETER